MSLHIVEMVSDTARESMFFVHLSDILLRFIRGVHVTFARALESAGCVGGGGREICPSIWQLKERGHRIRHRQQKEQHMATNGHRMRHRRQRFAFSGSSLLFPPTHSQQVLKNLIALPGSYRRCSPRVGVLRRADMANVPSRAVANVQTLRKV